MKHEFPLKAFVGCRTTKERGARGIGISVFVQSEDTWQLVQTLPTFDNPSWLHLSDKHSILYSCHGDREVLSSYTVNASTGRIAFRSSIETGGGNPVHLAELPDGRTLVCSNYRSGTIALIALSEHGDLTGVIQIVHLHGEPGPHRTQQGCSHPHQAVVAPCGAYLLVPDKGLDRVFVMAIDSTSGRIDESRINSTKLREGCGPRHLAFHPQKPVVYLVGELDSTLTTCRWDASIGKLEPVDRISLLPRDFCGDSTGAGIAVGGDGRYVYVSNRGHDHLVTVEIGADGLPHTPTWTATRGTFPRFIAIGPGSDDLWVANETSHTIASFSGAAAGSLRHVESRDLQSESPMCVVFR